MQDFGRAEHALSSTGSMGEVLLVSGDEGIGPGGQRRFKKNLVRLVRKLEGPREGRRPDGMAAQVGEDRFHPAGVQLELGPCQGFFVFHENGLAQNDLKIALQNQPQDARRIAAGFQQGRNHHVGVQHDLQEARSLRAWMVDLEDKKARLG
jgi:hypothetical protein